MSDENKLAIGHGGNANISPSATPRASSVPLSGIPKSSSGQTTADNGQIPLEHTGNKTMTYTVGK